MSVFVSKVIWEMQFPSPAAKLVALALADMSNDGGECFPSIGHVTDRCNLDDRTVRSWIAWMTAKGVLSKSPNYIRGRQTSNTYQFNVAGLRVEPSRKWGGSHPVGGSHPAGGTGVPSSGRDGGPIQWEAINHKKEPSEEPSSDGLTATLRAEAIYSKYPRKVGKPVALSAIKKAAIKVHLTVDGVETDVAAFAWLLDKTTQFQKATETWKESDRKYIPHPATWFNQERYNDDPSTWSRDSKEPHHGRHDTASGLIDSIEVVA